MKTRITIFIAVVIAVVATIIGYNVYNQRQGRSTEQSMQSATSSSSSNTQKNSSNAKGSQNGKTLIVYFSRKDGVYGGNLKVGNTKRIADFIQDKTGGKEYEIVPIKEYPKSYQATTEVAQKEQDDNARPKIKNKLPNVD